MKKLLSAFLICCMCFATILFTGCDTSKSDLENLVKQDIYDYYETLKTYMKEAKSPSEFASKVNKLCKEEELKSNLLDGNNIAIKIDKTEETKNTKSNIIYVGYDFDDANESCQSMAMAMALAKNITLNGDVEILIVDATEQNGESGINKLDEKYLQADNLIYLTDWYQTRLFNASAGTKEYNLHGTANMQAPIGNLAYQISITGVNNNNDDSGDRKNSHTNPITTIGDMLSSARAAGINIEIAEFSGGGESDIYPQNAQAVVVIDESVKAKFESRLENAVEKFEKKVKEDDSEAEFSYAVTDMPSKVLNYDDSARFVALLYTLTDGVFETTEPDYEGDIIGVSTIYKVDMENGINVNILGRSIQEQTSVNMDNTLTATAQLSDFAISSNERYKIWNPGLENDFLKNEELNKILKEYDIDREYSYLFKEIDIAKILEKNNELNMVIMGVDIDESVAATMALIEYLQSEN